MSDQTKGCLVIVEAFTKHGKVLVVVPLCKVGVLEFLLCLYIERAPCLVEVFEELKRGCAAVGCVMMFQLGVELLVDCITKIRSDTLEESFPNVPTCV